MRQFQPKKQERYQMSYQIKYLKEAIDQLAEIPRNIRNSILDSIDERLTKYPEIFKSLKGDLIGYYRLRIGKYRVIYKIQNDIVTIFIIRVNVRGDVYK